MAFDNVLLSLIIASTLFTSFYVYAKYKQTYWSRRGVFSPPGHWFFGHFRDVFLLRNAPVHVMAKLHHKYTNEPVIGFYVFQKPFLLLRDPEVIKQILVKDFSTFPNRYFASELKNDVIGSSGLFTVHNPRWKYLRTKLSSAFTTTKLKNYFGLMLESAEQMSKHLKIKVGNGVARLHVKNLCLKYAVDVASSISFGVKTNSFVEPEPEFYRRTRNLFPLSIHRRITYFINFFFSELSDYMNMSLFEKHANFFRQVFWESMNTREKSGVNRNGIIDLLVEIKNEEQAKEFKVEGDQLLAQSAIFYAAALETSGMAFSSTLMRLAKHPDVQAKVRQELYEKFSDDNNLVYERLSELTYLQQVISETLRLHTSAPLIDRIAMEDYKIPGTNITIEKGTGVYITVIGLHTDPMNYPDPLKYDPDRFSKNRKQFIKPGTYMPFGYGPRTCIGMRTGIMQMMVGLITILREYEVFYDASYKNGISHRYVFHTSPDETHLYFKKSPLFK